MNAKSPDKRGPSKSAAGQRPNHQNTRPSDGTDLEWAYGVVIPDGLHRYRRIGDVAVSDEVFGPALYILERADMPRPTWSHRVRLAVRIVAEWLLDEGSAT